MLNDAQEFAATLVEKYGLEKAKILALEEVLRAQRAKDFYLLSVWREARRILEDEYPVDGNN